MENRILYSLTMETKATEPNMIEEFIICRFLSFDDAFDYAKKSILVDDISQISITIIKDNKVEPLITITK